MSERDYGDIAVPRLHDKIHCNVCDRHQDGWQFSFTYQQPLEYSREQRCRGQEGSAQFCEHLPISWCNIKAHIDDWRQQRGGGDWQACLAASISGAAMPATTYTARPRRHRLVPEPISTPA